MQGLLGADGERSLDVSAAAALFQRGCERGSGEACLRIFSLLRSPERPRMPRPDELEGYLSRGCEAEEAKACFEAALLRVRRGEINVETRRLLERGCDGAHELACVNFSWMLWRGDGGARQPARAHSLMKQLCERGVSPACDRLPAMNDGRFP